MDTADMTGTVVGGNSVRSFSRGASTSGTRNIIATVMTILVLAGRGWRVTNSITSSSASASSE